jgi:hypothetical protein
LQIVRSCYWSHWARNSRCHYLNVREAILRRPAVNIQSTNSEIVSFTSSDSIYYNYMSIRVIAWLSNHVNPSIDTLVVLQIVTENCTISSTTWTG